MLINELTPMKDAKNRGCCINSKVIAAGCCCYLACTQIILLLIPSTIRCTRGHAHKLLVLHCTPEARIRVACKNTLHCIVVYDIGMNCIGLYAGLS